MSVSILHTPFRITFAVAAIPNKAVLVIWVIREVFRISRIMKVGPGVALIIHFLAAIVVSARSAVVRHDVVLFLTVPTGQVPWPWVHIESGFLLRRLSVRDDWI